LLEDALVDLRYGHASRLWVERHQHRSRLRQVANFKKSVEVLASVPKGHFEFVNIHNVFWHYGRLQGLSGTGAAGLFQP
jgi:hypothetical protein